jgi:hypothetical protein
VRKPVFFSAGIIVLALSLVGCGKSMSSSPVAPDGPVAASSASATLSGTVGSGLGSGLASTTSGATTGLTISVVGSTQMTTVDSLGRFNFVITPSGNVQLRVTGPGLDSTTTVGAVTAGDKIEVTIVVSGGAAEIEDSDHSTGESREIEGLVSAVPPATAAGTFVVAGKTITTNGSTVFRHGDTTLTFAAVTVGTRVHVKAAPTTGTVITATEVNIQNPPEQGPPATAKPAEPNEPNEPGDDNGRDGQGKEADISGAVTSLGGACPAISFTIGTTHVTTSASTRFDSACSSIANTSRVEVKGTRAADGSIAATRVKKD